MRPADNSEITVYKPFWFKRQIQFLQNGSPIGDLRFTSMFRMNATANLFGEQWTIMQSGFWKTSLEFKAQQSPYTKAKIQLGFRGQAEYKATNGDTYTFRKVKWWKIASAWFDRSGNPVMEIRSDHTLSKRQAHIRILKTGEPDITVMMLMAFLIFTIQRTKAAAASS
jgi:hypothetical protein